MKVAFGLSRFLGETVSYKTVSISLCFKNNRHGLVKHLGEFGSTCAVASIKETKIPSYRQAFSGQKVQVAL
jgi:hypothetical protein